jgi:hypothetical protein
MVAAVSISRADGGIYLPIKINTPAIMPKMAITVPAPSKVNRGIKTISPLKISQMANSNMPMFLVNFISASGGCGV